MDRLEQLDAEWMDAALGPGCECMAGPFCFKCGGAIPVEVATARLAQDAVGLAVASLDTARRSERLNRVIVANGWAIIALAAVSVALQAIGMWG